MIDKKYKIILASNSPRRQELLSGIDIEYEIRVINDINESYPDDIASEDVAEFLAIKKANSYHDKIKDNELLITADTVVLKGDEVLGKPEDKLDAQIMLNKLSDTTHLVITGVCIYTTSKQVSFSNITKVTFGKLSDDEIEYYIDTYKPYDKAGAYGIQEWIGFVGVKHIEGSYFNVMGLPIYRIYDELKKF